MPPGSVEIGMTLTKRINIRIFLSLILLLFFSCGSKDEEPPEVEITKPVEVVVCNICEVSAIARDNIEVVKIEIYLDNQLVQSAEDSICVYQWNTRSAPDNSSHIIYANVYDLEGNKGTSDTLKVITFNNLDSTEIFVWLYDQADIFYDSTLGLSVDCAYWIKQTIINNGYDCDVLNFLPPDLSSYKIGFVTLGWERC